MHLETLQEKLLLTDKLDISCKYLQLQCSTNAMQFNSIEGEKSAVKCKMCESFYGPFLGHSPIFLRSG